MQFLDKWLITIESIFVFLINNSYPYDQLPFLGTDMLKGWCLSYKEVLH